MLVLKRGLGHEIFYSLKSQTNTNIFQLSRPLSRNFSSIIDLDFTKYDFMLHRVCIAMILLSVTCTLIPLVTAVVVEQICHKIIYSSLKNIRKFMLYINKPAIEKYFLKGKRTNLWFGTHSTYVILIL